MEQIEFDYPAAKRRINKRAHVGVVGSGDMEVLMEPTPSEGAHVSITTSVDGFRRYLEGGIRSLLLKVRLSGSHPGQ